MASTSASSSARPRLFILGATGATGRALVDQALERGHRLTAFVRSPQKLVGPRAALTVVQGDPRSVDALRAALPGHDAVLSMLGPPGPGPTTIVADCARSTVIAMGDAGVSRLLIVGVGALFEQGPLTALIRGTFLRNVAKDAAEMERVVTTSGLDWTIVRVPRLTNGPLTGRYRAEDERMPRDNRSPAMASLSRADAARFLLSEVEHRAHVRRIVGIASVKGPPTARVVD